MCGQHSAVLYACLHWLLSKYNINIENCSVFCMFSLFNFSSIFLGGQLIQFVPMCGRPWHRAVVRFSRAYVKSRSHAGNESVSKIIINNTMNFLKTVIRVLLTSNNKRFRVLFDEIASTYFIWRIYLYSVLFCDGTSRYGVPENLTTG